MTNIRGSSGSLSALDRIEASSTDAITTDEDGTGTITLAFGADTAFINILQNGQIVNNGFGDLAIGLIFSNQILGVGNNVGINTPPQPFSNNPYLVPDENQTSEDIRVLGMDMLALLGEDEEFISAIIPAVPVMIRSEDRWQLKSPSRSQILDNTAKAVMVPVGSLTAIEKKGGDNSLAL